MFDPFSNFNPFTIARSAPGFSCYYDKDKQENVLEADVPGLESKDISIKLESNKKIIVNIERKCHDDRIYMFNQPWCGKFNQTIQLAKDINSNDILTSYKNGVVTISIKNQKDVIVNGIQSKFGNETTSSTSYQRSF